MPQPEDLAGRIFGRLTVIKEGPAYLSLKGVRLARWWCSCACGRVSNLIQASNLRSGGTRSCGCIHRNQGTTHGQAGGKKSKTYNSWRDMKKRCNNPNHRAYADYGGRGIKVCQRWQDSFDNFLEDMGPKPNGYTLDRIDNDGNYEPGNCRWASARTQANNRRNNILVIAEGVEDTLANHCRRLNLRYSVVKQRIRSGWPIEKALNTPTEAPFKQP